jgi:hypothetical protein
MKLIIPVPIINHYVKLKHDEKEKEENYYVPDIVALVCLRYPLGTVKTEPKDGNVANYNFDNINCIEIKKDYSDEKFLTENNIEIVNLKPYGFIHHSATSDGNFINTESGYVMKINYLNKDGKGRIKLTINEKTKNGEYKTKTVIAEELIADIFLKKPKESNKLLHKNGLERDISAKNLQWIVASEEELQQDKDKLKRKKNSKKDYKYNVQEDVLNEEVKDRYEKEIEDIYGFDNDTSEDSDEISEVSDLKDMGDEKIWKPYDDPKFWYKKEEYTPHDSIYEEFESSDVEYDLEGCFEKDGKLWKKAKYKENELPFHISENMDIYSCYSKKVLSQENSKDFFVLENGENTYRFKIKGQRQTIYIKDILASTFLKTPKDAVIAVHRKWNKNSEYKYKGQINHYTNIRWLREKDFVDVYDPKEKLCLSKQGDLYSYKAGTYKLLKEKQKSNGIRKVKLTINQKK